MRRYIRVVGIGLIFCLLISMIASAETSPPAWERYAPGGGQLDDTAYEDIRAWLLIPGNRESVLPYSYGNEVLASTIVENARSLVGKYPYVYGGESPEEGGFDCTGLVWYVYNRMSGLDITLSQAGRSKSALAAAGEKIYDHDAFLPGDVIQFTYAHVAIYVGDGRVVHARTTGTYIQETDLNYSNVEYAVRYPGVVQSDILASGTAGTLSWTLRRNGEMTVSGEGAIPDYADDASVPWSNYRQSVVSVTLDETVTAIGDFAFYGCENIKSISAPGIEKIGHAAFYDCGKLTEFSFSGSVTSIGMWAFYRCEGLTELILPRELISIDKGAFFGCTGLVNVTVPENVTSMGDWVFENCSGLRSVSLPDGVTSIGESMFFGCESLTQITMGGGVEAIDEYAFYGCKSLASIAIPKTVTSIGDFAFADCASLASVTFSGTVTLWAAVEIGANNDPILSAEIICIGIPDTPVIELTVDAAGIPTITWEAVKSAAKYEIWRATDETGVFTKLCELTETEYRDETAVPGTTYYYMIRSVSGRTFGKYSDIVAILQMRRCYEYAVPPKW